MPRKWNRQKSIAVVESGVWLLLAVAAWILTADFAEEFSLFRWGADFWPRAVAILMAGIALMSLLSTLTAPPIDDVGSRDAVTLGDQSEQREAAATSNGGLVMAVKYGATFLIPILYVYMLPRAGYFATTPFFIIAMAYVFGVRRPSLLFAAPLAFYALTVIIFSKLLYVPLARGHWQTFHDFSNLILDWVR